MKLAVQGQWKEKERSKGGWELILSLRTKVSHKRVMAPEQQEIFSNVFAFDPNSNARVLDIIHGIVVTVSPNFSDRQVTVKRKGYLFANRTTIR